MTALLSVLAVLFALAAIYPFVLYPLSLLAVRRRPHPPRPEVPERVARPARCAVCVCAYNEARIIDRKVQNLLALKAHDPDVELLVYVDGATDGTAQLLERYAQEIDVCIAAERRGKTHGMNVLASRTRAPILVFSDANVMLDPECLEEFRRQFSDPQVGCVCGNLIYTNPGESVTSASGSAYWRFEQAVKRLELDSGSVIGADGSLFAVRRSLRRPPPDDIIDDLYVSLMVLCQRFTVVQSMRARAYEESVSYAREEFTRKVRIACQAFNVHRLLWPRLRALDRLTLYKYVAHKLIRWLSGYFLLLAAACAAAAMLSAGLIWPVTIGVPLLALLLVGGSYFGIWPVAQLADVLLAIAATAIGVWQSLRGERYQTWTPANSVRRA
jgi:cellulose synthase/poly-beta-1,6-N-acetylglucosamine synthase-like glycosyltransferase